MSTFLRILPEIFGLFRLIPAVRKYFEVERRRVRTQLISNLALDVLSFVALQKGVSPETAADLEETIQLMVERLLGEGIDPTQAEAIARRSVAGALAKLRAREDLVGGSQ